MRELANPWVPVQFAAHVAGRSRRTVQTWARRGVVRKTGRGAHLRVHIGDVAKQSTERPRRAA
jgi:phage terminase Nu1 subunit (DNA packaging protein)